MLFEQKPEQLLNEVIETIRQNCQPFLDEAREPLYRGSGSLSAGKKPTLDSVLNHAFIRKDRKARDNKQEFNDFIDDITKDAVGFKMRSEGLFTTTSYDAASHYGNVGLVFPVGDFKFAYSPLVQDLYFTFFDWGTEEWNEELARVMQPYIIPHDENAGRVEYSELGGIFAGFTSDVQHDIVKRAIQDNIDTFFKTKYLGAAQLGSHGHEIIITNDTGYYIIPEDVIRDYFEITLGEFYEML